MGLGYHCVEAIVREHKYKPISGDVLLIGRQTVYFSPAEILKLMREHEIDTGLMTANHIGIDRSTMSRSSGYEDQEQIKDSELFKLLGVPKVLALDHSDYEGAEIVHDLTKPVPNNLHGCTDFIVDGSTLDNVFDPAMVIRNFSDMLRPRGRLITTNVFSNDYEPYAIMPPLWYLDYFVANGFTDCKVYILVSPFASGAEAAGKAFDSAVDVFTFNTDMLLDSTKTVSAFGAPRVMMTIVLAEKGDASTSTVTPSQQHYRSAEEWAIYRNNLAEMKKSLRPHIVRALGDISFEDVKAGHLFVANDFTERDPWTEVLAKRRKAEPSNVAEQAKKAWYRRFR